MKLIPTIILVIFLLSNFVGCEKKSVPPESSPLESPDNIRIASGFRSIKLHWTPLEHKTIAGYKIYYGTTASSYSDTIFVTKDISQTEIMGLEDDRCYFCAMSTVDINNHEGNLSQQVAIRTYIAFENFSHQAGPLDSLTWWYHVGYPTYVVASQVVATETQFNNERVSKSFGQYLKYTLTDSFVVECDFKLGIPNVGGAGLMIRSEKANPEMYYKGYNAFLFWDFNRWELRLEESLVDKEPMPRKDPVTIPAIGSEEWVKLSLMYKNGVIHASLFRVADHSLLGTITSEDKISGKRPFPSDIYCGFFTTQYGGNIIYVDNFGIRRTE